jgi:hypothetical protein
MLKLLPLQQKILTELLKRSAKGKMRLVFRNTPRACGATSVLCLWAALEFMKGKKVQVVGPHYRMTKLMIDKAREICQEFVNSNNPEVVIIDNWDHWDHTDTKSDRRSLSNEYIGISQKE